MNKNIRVAHMYDFPAGKMVKVYLRNAMTGVVLSNEYPITVT